MVCFFLFFFFFVPLFLLSFFFFSLRTTRGCGRMRKETSLLFSSPLFCFSLTPLFSSPLSTAAERPRRISGYRRDDEENCRAQTSSLFLPPFSFFSPMAAPFSSSREGSNRERNASSRPDRRLPFFPSPDRRTAEMVWSKILPFLFSFSCHPVYILVVVKRLR